MNDAIELLPVEEVGPDDNEALCFDEHYDGEGGDWVCTREKGHDGRHVAFAGPGEAYAAWGDTPAVTTLPASAAPRLLTRILPHGVGLPAYQTAGAAGLDLCAAWNVAHPDTWPTKIATSGRIDYFIDDALLVYPGAIVSIPTGIAVAIPEGHEGQVRGRSGLLFRHGVAVPQTGTIDSDYRGEIRVALHNSGPDPFAIRRGDRIAQLVISPVARVQVVQVDELPATVRGDSGFGSTGTGGAR